MVVGVGATLGLPASVQVSDGTTISTCLLQRHQGAQLLGAGAWWAQELWKSLMLPSHNNYDQSRSQVALIKCLFELWILLSISLPPFGFL